jgi:hypothetical protein
MNLPFEKSILPDVTYAVLYVKGDAQDAAKAQMGLFRHTQLCHVCGIKSDIFAPILYG